MRAPESVSTAVERLDRLGPFALTTRALIAVAALVCWVGAGSLGGYIGFVTVLFAIAVFPAVLLPDSAAPLALILVMIGGWVAEVRPLSPLWSIVLAGCVLLVHVASARAAAIVPGVAFDRASAVLWLRQTGVVAAVTGVIWMLVVRLSDSPGGSSLIVTAIALVAVAALGIGLVVTSAPSRNDPGSAG